jgi:hypothetical protein
MEVTTIGIDLAKSVFAVSGADSRGRVVIRRQLRRAQVLGFMRGLSRGVVGRQRAERSPAERFEVRSAQKVLVPRVF